MHVLPASLNVHLEFLGRERYSCDFRYAAPNLAKINLGTCGSRVSDLQQKPRKPTYTAQDGLTVAINT